MVKDTFHPENRNQYMRNTRNNITIEEFKEPIMELISSLKDSIKEYNSKTKSNYALQIIENNRVVGNIHA